MDNYLYLNTNVYRVSSLDWKGTFKWLGFQSCLTLLPVCDHSGVRGDEIKFQIPEIKASQGEQACFKDPKNCFFEKIENGA